jgi:hypothetical protein
MGKENQNDIQKEVQKKMYTLVPNHLKDWNAYQKTTNNTIKCVKKLVNNQPQISIWFMLYWEAMNAQEKYLFQTCFKTNNSEIEFIWLNLLAHLLLN